VNTRPLLPITGTWASTACAASDKGRFCCKTIFELGRRRARRTRFLLRHRLRMEIPARALSAEHDSISRAVYQMSERILQQNRHQEVTLGLVARAAGTVNSADTSLRAIFAASRSLVAVSRR
jgi:hypothetical protein